MQGNHLFEYAIIRAVPRVEREEFLNIGVILYCRRLSFLQVLFSVDEARLRAVYAEMDIPQLQCYLHAFEQIATGSKEGGPIGKLDIASRFRWLTATRSTVLQTSKVHPGMCSDPQIALHKLFAEQVL
ncbi:DUF3037 domain-containing protein [Chitinophagaceae bacterium MMS25-I14]